MGPTGEHRLNVSLYARTHMGQDTVLKLLDTRMGYN